MYVRIYIKKGYLSSIKINFIISENIFFFTS